MIQSSTHSAIARQLAFSLVRHGGLPALDAEPLARGQVYALPAADFVETVVDQTIKLLELTRRRSVTQVWVSIAYGGDSLVEKLTFIAFDMIGRAARAFEATVSRRPVHYSLGA
jgi:hypothetical protein